MFDDTDPDESTYLGIAKIPLITLAHDKPIQGTFELARVFTYVLFHILISSLGLTLFYTDWIYFQISLLTYCIILTLFAVHFGVSTISLLH